MCNLLNSLCTFYKSGHGYFYHILPCIFVIYTCCIVDLTLCYAPLLVTQLYTYFCSQMKI
ncbi:hypothetical protein L873DRAFT_1162598 [Choiromyces venosus 120613-1]|uniref:Uncharacterized protein n=1 Tax=Choiromyces venosus 120613-1 TaxID=1336337 RepID=A0A3N4JFD7_9PEZI|nr:hypothetical protein L873DRAFT_1162598 [Choiromyces venosus 120613-1]